MSVSHLTGVTPRATKNVTMFMAAILRRAQAVPAR